MENNKIIDEFLPCIDKKYQAFHSRLVNNIDPNRILGVRIPVVRKIAKQMVKNNTYNKILLSPNKYYIEELELYGMIVNNLRLSYEQTINYVQKMLPYIDNWAVCDTMQFDVFKKHPNNLLPQIKGWLKDKHIYTQRFGIVCLIKYFAGDMFNEEILNLSMLPKSNDYYIQMAKAWFYSVVAVKHFDIVKNLLQSQKLSTNVHNFTIKKCCESLRLTKQQKTILQELKIK